MISQPLSIALLALLPQVDGPPPADTIYHGGPVLTMRDDLPRAEAVAVDGGIIVAVGDEEEVMAWKGPGTRLVDLEGKTLLPGFVDAHGHVSGVGLQAMAANLLAPPDGMVTDIASLQEVMRTYLATYPERVAAVDLALGFGYDDSQLAEGRHPTREELDGVSTEVPVYIVHQSGHLAVANSKALEAMGIDESSDDPPGGLIRREEGSRRPSGVLEENAHFEGVMKLAGGLDLAGSEAMVRAGVELVSSYGYTTAQEGRASAAQVQVLRSVGASDEGLPIDVAIYPDVLMAQDLIGEETSREYVDRVRVAGAKLTIDGSPQGFTAWRDRPYYKPPSGQRPDYAGYPAATPEQVYGAVEWAFANDIQILTHSNGEAASDLLIAALIEATEKHGHTDRRPVLIHGQFLREDQVQAFCELQVFPSLFPMHTFYWGDWHRERTVGPVRAENISPTGWFLERGSRFSSHHDAPVAFPDSMRVLDATVTRRSRSADILGPAHRVDVLTALKAMTIWPAYQHFEEDRKGSLEVGKLADLIVLSDDPTAIDPELLDTMRVLRTIKEDRVIYEAPAEPTGPRHGSLDWRPGGGGTDTFAALLRGAVRAGDHRHAAPACATDFLFKRLLPVYSAAARELEARTAGALVSNADLAPER